MIATALGTGAQAFAPAVRWRGQTAGWLARTSDGFAILRLDQRLVRLHLHSGTLDAGSGFPFGAVVDHRETGRLVAGFNGLYAHHGRHGPLIPEPVLPGQHGVAGFFLTPYSRDFFIAVAR